MPELIADKYRVLKTLGQGGMGEVYLVLPPRGDPVALKLLKTADSANQQAAVTQFENEFRVLKKLSHPNIGRIYDYGYDNEQKKVYFTSPWLKGVDIFSATNNFPFEKCEDLFVQLLRALNYLHQKGIIHCDLKPGNVYVEDGRVLLIDFGLAGYWGASIVGTPAYLAPEIFQGERHSVSSDLYATGIIFYNCLARTQPFSGKSLNEIYDRQRTYMPPHLSELNPTIPKYLGDITATLLQKKASERYSGALAVIEEISAYSARKYPVETEDTLLSYLPKTSELVGRLEVCRQIDSQIKLFLSDAGKADCFGIYIHGESGVGKTRFLNQIKTRLQLEKISVEEVVLPLQSGDKKVLSRASVVILEDVDHHLDVHYRTGTSDHSAGGYPNRALREFLSFLEQRIISTKASRLFFIASGTREDHWKLFEPFFPAEEFRFESLLLSPLTRDEMRIFLEMIIGQKEIPENFINEVYRNTGGNPSLCEQIMQNLIRQHLLFDESGRWSADLLASLDKALKRSETPGTLEEKLGQEYNTLSQEEEEVVVWLAMAPHGLARKALGQLTGIPGIKKLLKRMQDRKQIRRENKNYFIYKSAFIPFIRKTVSDDEQRRRHTVLAEKNRGFSQSQIWYHESRGSDRNLAQSSLEKLAEALEKDGRKEGALECYEILMHSFGAAMLAQRVSWHIRASEVLIWLDRFEEAVQMLSEVEKEVVQSAEVPLTTKLLLWEKKGLALLNRQKIAEADLYFTRGLKFASDNKDILEQIRFINDLAQIDIITGHPEKAVPRFEKSRKEALRLSKDDVKHITNNDLGHVYCRLGEHEKAVGFLKEDIRIFSALPNREPMARAVYALAESFRALKKFRRSIREYERCLAIARKDNLFPLMLRAYNGLGNIYLLRGKNREAIECYQKALEISIRLKDPVTKAALLANQGVIYRREKNLPQATRRFLLARQILESRPQRLAYEQELLSKCYFELGDIALCENDSLKAISFKGELVKIVEQLDSLRSEKFPLKLEMANLYLENRLSEAFDNQLKNLTTEASSDDEKQKVEALKKRWETIRQYDQEGTVKVG